MPLFRLLLVLLVACASQAHAKPPKLVLLVVIDQFRADYLTRFEGRFLPAESGGKIGGFSYLMKRGAYWPYAQFDYLQCMTGPGHATISTGAYPYQFGIPANHWYDSVAKRPVYCTEDPIHATVGVDSAKPGVGTSPRSLVGTTFGDELKSAGHPSRVISVSLKDRSAILMGGHRADLALWFDSTSFRWVSSRYYLPEGKLPAWVEELNTAIEKRRGEKLSWSVTGPGSGLSTPKALTLATDKYVQRLGPEFPHTAEIGASHALNLPYGVEITTAAAVRAFTHYRLGQGKAPDVLAVSYSTHDYTGHTFGPNSRELEELTVIEDRALSQLLNTVRASVPGGLENVVVVLTADHGAPASPEYLIASKVPAGRIDDALLEKKIETRLNERFGKPRTGKWIDYNNNLSYVLNPDAIADRKVEKSKVEDAAKEVIAAEPGVARAIGSTDMPRGLLPFGQLERQFKKTFYAGRSADLFVIPKPYFVTAADAVDHLTGYNYDRLVPLVIAGPGMRAGRYAQTAEIIDIAPTLAFLLGVMPPALSEGRVLSEAISPR